MGFTQSIQGIISLYAIQSYYNNGSGIFLYVILWKFTLMVKIGLINLILNILKDNKLWSVRSDQW